MTFKRCKIKNLNKIVFMTYLQAQDKDKKYISNLFEIH